MSTIQDSLTRQFQHDHEQPITKSTNRLQLQSSPVSTSQSSTANIFAFNSCLHRLQRNCSQLWLVSCEFEDFAVTCDVIKWIFTNFYEFKNFRKIREFFRRILNTEFTNSQSMVLATIRCRSAQNDAQFLCASVELIFTIARDAASTSSCTRCWYDLTNDRHHLLLSPVHILQPTTLYSCCIITL